MNSCHMPLVLHSPRMLVALFFPGSHSSPLRLMTPIWELAEVMPLHCCLPSTEYPRAHACETTQSSHNQCYYTTAMAAALCEVDHDRMRQLVGLKA